MELTNARAEKLATEKPIASFSSYFTADLCRIVTTADSIDESRDKC